MLIDSWMAAAFPSLYEQSDVTLRSQAKCLRRRALIVRLAIQPTRGPTVIPRSKAATIKTDTGNCGTTHPKNRRETTCWFSSTNARMQSKTKSITKIPSTRLKLLMTYSLNEFQASSSSSLTRSRNSLPGLKCGTNLPSRLTDCPVLGLRPTRGAR